MDELPRIFQDRQFGCILGGEAQLVASAAYAQLDTIDSYARYHAALLKVHTGNVAESRALADTILASDPGHLFGYVVRGTVARFRKDEKEPSGAYGGFLKRYDPEMKLIGRNTANIKAR